MNKKLATLLFAIGIGASAGSALAIPGDPLPCSTQCFNTYKACKAAGVDLAQCDMDFSACRDRCGI
jgi:hypothetical protein